MFAYAKTIGACETAAKTKAWKSSFSLSRMKKFVWSNAQNRVLSFANPSVRCKTPKSLCKPESLGCLKFCDFKINATGTHKTISLKQKKAARLSRFFVCLPSSYNPYRSRNISNHAGGFALASSRAAISWIVNRMHCLRIPSGNSPHNAFHASAPNFLLSSWQIKTNFAPVSRANMTLRQNWKFFLKLSRNALILYKKSWHIFLKVFAK